MEYVEQAPILAKTVVIPPREKKNLAPTFDDQNPN